MKIFINMKKRKLIKKVYEYTLKAQDALAKSEYFLELSYVYFKSSYDEIWGSIAYIENSQKNKECRFQSEHYKNLAKMYEDMKADAEKELNNLS